LISLGLCRSTILKQTAGLGQTERMRDLEDLWRIVGFITSFLGLKYPTIWKGMIWSRVYNFIPWSKISYYMERYDME